MNYKDKLTKISNNVSKITSKVTENTKNSIENSQKLILSKLDVNGDGEVGIEDVIVLGLKVPGVKVNRTDFLRKEFSKRYSEDVIKVSIDSNPFVAGISVEEIDNIADSVIKYERNCVSGISAVLGAPGGFSMLATLPTDIAQYYGYMIRTMQKLMYLYGFPEIDFNENNTLDSETTNVLILCFGVMYGVAGANSAIKVMAKGLANGVSKKIMTTALTKGTLYPIIKKIAKWFGINMTKKILSSAAKNSIPIIGGVVGGGITFFSFKPCCDKLKNSLRDTNLTNPNYIESKEEIELQIK